MTVRAIEKQQVVSSGPRRSWRAAGTLSALVGLVALLGILTFGTDTLEAQGIEGKAASSDSIFGSWKVNCENAQGMVVEITGSGNNAKGNIKALGKAGRFKYSQGEEILRLKKSGTGWSGQLSWRNTQGTQRWQPITFVMESGRLHGKTANEHCYEYMQRAN